MKTPTIVIYNKIENSLHCMKAKNREQIASFIWDYAGYSSIYHKYRDWIKQYWDYEINDVTLYIVTKTMLLNESFKCNVNIEIRIAESH